MKKRIAAVVFLLIFALCLTLLCSCGREGEKETETEQPIAGIPLVTRGECRFRIVRSDSKSEESAEARCALLIKNAIKTVTGADAELTCDSEDKDGNDEIFEILIGDTNRKASAEALSGLSEDEYLVKLYGNKLVVAGNGDDMLCAATALFLQNHVGYTSENIFTESKVLAIPEALEELMKYDRTSSVVIFCTNSSVTYTSDLLCALKVRYENVSIAAFDASPGSVFDPDKNDLVIIAGANCVPAGTTTAIDAYLRSGGKILTLGGPAFTEEVYLYDGSWVSRADLLKNVLSELGDSDKKVLYDTGNEKIVGSFFRSTNTPKNKSYITIDDYRLSGSEKQLKLEVTNLDSWDVFNFNVAVRNKGYSSLGFYAKGAPDTDAFYIEITEKDDTRWCAVQTLTSEWDYYFLSNLDFEFWSGDQKRAKGTANLSNIKTFSIGFAQSGRVMATGHHEVYLSMPTLFCYDGLKKSDDARLELDGLSPSYELFPINNGASVTACTDQIFVPALDYKLTDGMVSCSPGRKGTGYGNGKEARFIPLIEVKDKDGLHSGYAAWINVLSSTGKQNGAYEGSVIASFGPTDNSFYNNEGLSAVCSTADAILLPAHLVEGGMNEYLYVEGDDTKWKAGTRFVVYDGDAGDKITAKVSLFSGDTLLKEYKDEEPYDASSKIQNYSHSEKIGDVRPDRAVTELMLDGRTIDKIIQPITFWSPKAESERHYITKEDGYFKQDGKIINFFGVNYMPSYGTADPDADRFCHYTLRRAYDPDVVYDDLLHIKSLGMNAVAVAVGMSEINSNNFIDLLNKCDSLGIYCDVYIGTSSDDLLFGSTKEFTSLMDGFHLREFDNIICFDIAWEPRLGAYEDGVYIGRKRFDASWRSWIDTQYGSLSAAEKLWGVKCPATGSGKALGVTDAMLNDKKGTYDKIVAAYRRFIDDTLSQKFSETFSFLHSLDENHLFTFRMSMSGSALETQYFAPSGYCFDFMSLASSVSLMQPEGYALDSTNDTSMLQVIFANAYARYAEPDAPVEWKEYGKTVWYGSNFGPRSFPLELQRDYYEKVLSYALAAESNAMFCWYYAGGYRVDENSDYGIFDPDGSPRPAAEVLREYASKFIGQGERKAADITITVERDDSARGIFGMFDKCRNTLREAYDEGKTVRIVNKMQDADASTLTKYAVGGTDAEGLYPLRYVNGIVSSAEKIKRDGKTFLHVTVVNTLPSIWKAGTVYLTDKNTGNRVLIDKDVPYLGTAELEIEVKTTYSLRFEVNGVAFGPAYTVKK